MVETKEQQTMNEKMKAVEAAAKNFDEENKEKVGESVDDYKNTVNDLVDKYNKGEINKEDIAKELMDIGIITQRNPKNNNITKSIEDILFQLDQWSKNIESLLDQEVLTKRIKRTTEIYEQTFADIKNWYIIDQLKTNGIDIESLGMNKQKIIDNMMQYYLSPDTFVYDYEDGKKRDQTKKMQVIIGIYFWSVDRASWTLEHTSSITEELHLGLMWSHEEMEFKKNIKGTLVHELIHACQTGNIEKKNIFNEKDKQYRIDQGIKEPSKEIIYLLSAMIREWSAVSLTGIIEKQNGLSYNQVNVIAINYLFLMDKNGEKLREDFIRFSLNGRKMDQKEIDNFLLSLYTAIANDEGICSALWLGQNNEWKRWNLDEEKTVKLMEKVRTSSKDLSFFKACCARTNENDEQFKNTIINAITAPNQGRKSPIEKWPSGWWLLGKA